MYEGIIHHCFVQRLRHLKDVLRKSWFYVTGVQDKEENTRNERSFVQGKLADGCVLMRCGLDILEVKSQLTMVANLLGALSEMPVIVC